MAEYVEFHNIFQNAGGNLVEGTLRVNDELLAWRSKAGKDVTVPKAGVRSIEWMALSKRACQLRFLLAGGALTKFQGFVPEDLDKLEPHISKIFNKEVTTVDMCVNGRNWGKITFGANADGDEDDLTQAGPNMTFKINTGMGHDMAFELPLKAVEEVAKSKNTLTMTMREDEMASRNKDSLVELRLYVPPPPKGEDGVEEGEKMLDVIHDTVLQAADLGEDADSCLVTLEYVQLRIPAGRYDIKMFPKSFVLEGKSSVEKIQYDNINRLFLLPKPDNVESYFVVRLETPLRRGNTRYPFVVMSHRDETELEVNVNISEEDIKEHYTDEKGQRRIEPELTGPESKVIAKIFRALANHRIVQPKEFVTDLGAYAVNASYKTDAGLLFPLKHEFMYLHKPVVHIKYEDITLVEFSRHTTTTMGSQKSFDIKVKAKNHDKDHIFGAIPNRDFEKMLTWISDKGIKIKNEKNVRQQMMQTTQSGRGGPMNYDENNFAAMDLGSDDDDDDAEDDDFAGGDSDAGSSEFDSDGSDFGSEGESGEEKKSKKKKKKKKKKSKDGEPKAKKRKSAGEGGGKKKKAVKKDDDSGSEFDSDAEAKMLEAAMNE